ncbi:hypothetical protein GCM10022261_26630 [Brevibacterium daeguense]|uniref:Protein-glutamine gamma-glutamyltransferase-like C-terminal domain-containing protein n=1 Tax=Brevibacterium daeguense TaxID=909936 RepID=A0ABP8EMC8_9MICO
MSTAEDPVLAPGRDEARQWAEDELADPVYRESDLTLLERLGRAFGDLLSDLFGAAGDIRSPWLLFGVIALVIALVVLIAWRVGRGSGGSLRVPRHDVRVADARLDPDELRARARRAAAARDWNLAVQEGVRALLAALARSGDIDIGAASTASELSRAAAAARPDHAVPLLDAGAVFDAVTFGEGSADEAAYRRIERLDDQLHGSVTA